MIAVGEALQRAVGLDPASERGVSHIEAITGLRNRLVHGYFAIEWTRIVAIVEGDLDRLVTELDAALRARESGGAASAPEPPGLE